ncbi:hypothetical protein ACFE04_024345 [Oxalis oulophora]
MAKTKPQSNKSKKKTKLSGPDTVAMKQKANSTTPKPNNPFETIWSRRKFDILGKKRKGEERRLSLSRSLAIDKRNKTLLKEYKENSKASVFVDNRIGEGDHSLGEYDKAILRTQKLKLNKKSKYNLSDGEDEQLEITGLGLRDDFDEDIMPDDDDETDERGKNFYELKDLNSSEVLDGEKMEGEENRYKTKKQVMEEVILKSKFFKAQKAKEKEENELLKDEINDMLSALVAKGNIDDLNGRSKKDDPPVTKKMAMSTLEQPDSYDKIVSGMALESRARPSDRTRTPEEVAQEERERLKELEEERQKRMLASEDSSEEDNDEDPAMQRPRLISGDDLGDSFSLGEEKPKTKKGWVDEILERENNDDSESDNEDDEESDSDDNEESDDEDNDKACMRDWEQSDDDTDSKEEDDDDDDDDEHDNDIIHDKKEKKSMKNAVTSGTEKKKAITVAADVPYLIEAPKNFEELCSLLENRSNENILLIIKRIRISNATNIKAENRKKMQVFYGLLLQYFSVSANKKPINFDLMNRLVKPLMEMSMEMNYFAAICARHRISKMRNQLCQAIKEREKGCWPSVKTLFLMRLWSIIFPCSDLRHVVMTPVILLICEYLMRCPISSGHDVAIGCFLCSILLSITKQSEKFSPEAIIFLRTLLMAATDRKATSCEEYEFYHLRDLKALRPLLRLHDSVNDIVPLNFLKLVDMPEDSTFFSSDNFRTSILANVVENLGAFVEIYKELSSFPELFLPISTLLNEVAQGKKMPVALQDKMTHLSQLITDNVDEHHIWRRPLQMRKQKPMPMKLVNPKYEENYVKGIDYDPDRERAEKKKLKKRVKDETKGAIRELRKDNYFLWEVKQKEKEQIQEERAEKYGKAKAFLQEQEHAFKSGQLGKGSKKRRK